MPISPSCVIEPLWDQFAALLPDRVDPHPLDCHLGASPTGPCAAAATSGLRLG
jgi:hypothetical protein